MGNHVLHTQQIYASTKKKYFWKIQNIDNTKNIEK